jgi:hypothetical protein
MLCEASHNKGKLNFYLEALDRNIRKAHEQPAIGVLLCASKNDEVVEFALSRSLSPALIAEYQTQLPDKKREESEMSTLRFRRGIGDSMHTRGKPMQQGNGGYSILCLVSKTYSRLLSVQRSETVDTTCRIRGDTRFFDTQQRGIWSTRMVDTLQHVLRYVYASRVAQREDWCIRK